MMKKLAISFVLAVLTFPRSFYRITLEGISDSGTPVHQEKYIKIAE